MERGSTGMKYIVANCEGSQNPPRAVKLRKKRRYTCTILLFEIYSYLYNIVVVVVVMIIVIIIIIITTSMGLTELKFLCTVFCNSN
jgi:hypothetical protein